LAKSVFQDDVFNHLLRATTSGLSFPLSFRYHSVFEKYLKIGFLCKYSRLETANFEKGVGKG